MRRVRSGARARGAPPLRRHLDGRVEPTLSLTAFRPGKEGRPLRLVQETNDPLADLFAFSSCRKWPAPAMVSAGPAPGIRSAIRAAARGVKIGSESEKRTSAGFSHRARAVTNLCHLAALGCSRLRRNEFRNASTPAFDSGVGKGAL